METKEDYQLYDEDEERWRRVVNIQLKIKDKVYQELFNISISVTLNLAIYLVKYLKRKASIAEKEAHFGIFALYKDKLKDIVQSTDYISEGDRLQLMHWKTNSEGSLKGGSTTVYSKCKVPPLQMKTNFNIKEITEPPQLTHIKNELGGFKVEFVNNYIKEVLRSKKSISNSILNTSNILINDGLSQFSNFSFSMNTSYLASNDFNRRNQKLYDKECSFMQKYSNQDLLDCKYGGLINSSKDIKKVVNMFQIFESMESFYKFVNTLQQKSQFQLNISEFRGYKNNQNQISIYCPQRPNCKFRIMYRYYMNFGDDLRMHEKIVFEEVGQLTHYHQERLEKYKLDKKYFKSPKDKYP